MCIRDRDKAIGSTRFASGLVAAVLYRHTTNPVAVPKGASVILELSTGPGPTTTTTAPATPTTTTTLAGQGLRAVPDVVGLDYAQTYAAMKKAVLYFTTTGPGAGTTTWTKVVSESPAAGTMVPVSYTHLDVYKRQIQQRSFSRYRVVITAASQSSHGLATDVEYHR